MFKIIVNSLSPTLKVFFFSFVLVQGVPEKISHQDYRGVSQSQVTIKQDMQSPAMGALIDIRNEYSQPQLLEIQNQDKDDWGNITLNAGKESAQLIEFVRPQSPQIQVADLELNESPELRGMTISQKRNLHIAQRGPQKIEEVDLFNKYGELLPSKNMNFDLFRTK